jgi:hypothetical protein
MTITMIRASVKEDAVAEAEAAVERMFAAIDEAQPQGVRYASTKLADGTTFVIFLQLDGDDNPLVALPEFLEFQASLKNWLAGPPTPEELTVVGSYGLFD